MDIKKLTNQIRSNKTWLDYISSLRKCHTVQDRILCTLNALKDARFLLLYMVLYSIMFSALEQTPRPYYNYIHMAIDDYIPFIEVFIIPYLFWFFFVGIIMVYLYFADREYYHRTSVFICIGMTLFLIISALWPNALALRPLVMPRDNIFTAMVLNLYASDTATNVFPSIHVFNTLGMMFGFLGCRGMMAAKTKNRVIVAAIGVSIIFSVLFLRQHSMFDVIGAFLLAIPIYMISFNALPQYGTQPKDAAEFIRMIVH